MKILWARVFFNLRMTKIVPSCEGRSSRGLFPQSLAPFGIRSEMELLKQYIREDF